MIAKLIEMPIQGGMLGPSGKMLQNTLQHSAYRKFGAGKPCAGQRSDTECIRRMTIGLRTISGSLGAVLDTGSEKMFQT